jgi:plastocyanin
MRRATLLLGLLAIPWAAWADTHVVTIEAMQFRPATLAVKPGDQVVWENRDLVPHTATAARQFDSGEIGANKRWTWTAREQGSYAYDCTYHPGMKGTVVVR